MSGALAAARDTLVSVDFTTLNRSNRLQFANFCRRVSLPLLGIAALKIYVRPSETQPENASPAELTEYAACLQWLGLFTEAESLLDKAGSHPGARLIAAFIAFGRWDYQRALKLLRVYLAASLSPYERLVGEVNLLSALVHERKNQEARDLGARLKEETLKFGNLYSSVLKQQLELAVSARDWVEAHRVAEGLKEQPGLDGHSKLFMQKWLALEGLYERPTASAAWRADLEAVKTFAFSLGHFETLRDCDYHEAVATHNPILAQKVFWGSPHVAYRDRFLLESKMELPSELNVKLNESEGEIIVKPREGAGFNPFERTAKQNPSRVSFRLIQALSNDFYAPKSLPQLFDQVFPGRYFSETSSPNLVHQSLFRARRSLPQLKIVERASRFYLRGSLSLPKPGSGRVEVFSSQEWAKRYNLSQRQAQREIQSLLGEGKLIQERRGRNILYRTRVK